MHISLDAALQRQPLLSTVGDKLLPAFPGAAAAYSLRALNGDANNVVNVRRDADDEERDFTAEGVAFELEDWVNGKLETTLPADVDTAAAAYSLRKVRNAYSGNAVQIRRASDDVEVNAAFDSNGEVSDISAISNVEDIELVSESGFATDTGGFESSISGANFTFGNTLDGKDNVLFATFDGAGLLGLNFSTSDVAIGDVVKYSFEVYWASTNVGGLPNLRIRSGNTTIGHSDVPMPSEDSWYTFSGQFTVTSNTPTALTFIAADSSGLTTGDVFAIANGSYDKQQDAGDTTATTLGEFLAEATPARNRTGPARYDTFTPDGVTGFTAITNNIAAGGFDIAGASGTEVQVSLDITLNSGTVTVSLRPAFETGSDVSNSETITTSGSKSFTLTATGDYKAMLFITASADYVISNFSVNVPYNHDATVVTWYDQSGNGNHATQLTTGSQPLIAENGSLLADGIDFDGFDDFLDVSGIDEAQPITGFLQLKPDATTDAANEVLDGTLVNTNRILLDASSGDWRLFAGSVLTGASVATTSSLLYFLANSTSSEFGLNGATALTGDAGTNSGWADGLTIGTSISGNFYDGTIGEIIFYPSDQSTNRFKIESNINNYYGIYTAAEDGFVETWYDQSGNGRHAVQDAVEGYQPKIVSAGSYLGALDFDGVDDVLIGSHNVTSDYSFFTVTNDTGSSTSYIADTGTTSGNGVNYGRTVDSSGNRQLTINHGGFSAVNASGFLVGESLISQTYDSTTINTSVNGASVGTTNQGYTASGTTLTVGASASFGAPFNGTMKEVILYSSDQSANRTGIESNIADEYGITLS